MFVNPSGEGSFNRRQRTTDSLGHAAKRRFRASVANLNMSGNPGTSLNNRRWGITWNTRCWEKKMILHQWMLCPPPPNLWTVYIIIINRHVLSAYCYFLLEFKSIYWALVGTSLKGIIPKWIKLAINMCLLKLSSPAPVPSLPLGPGNLHGDTW